MRKIGRQLSFSQLAVPDYQKELDRCGYNYKLTYSQPVNPTSQPTRRKRGGRRVTWFNPPYSIDVATNVAREFLVLVDRHFPPGHPLHSICNRATLKVSYRCLPNMGSVVAKHNKKILRKSSNAQPKPRATCNCHIPGHGIFGWGPGRDLGQLAIAKRRKTAQCLVSVIKMVPFTRPRYLLLGAGKRLMWA